MQSRYYLPEHVHACATTRYYMFLDIKRDRYYSLARTKIEPLARLIEGPQLSATAASGDDSADEHAGLFTELIHAGLISLTPGASGSRQPPPPRPIADVPSMQSDIPIRIRPRTLTRAARSLLWAQLALSTRSLEDIVSAVLRQRRSSQAGCDVDRYDRMSSLTKIFCRWRPVFPRNFLCMFDSLALIRFLSLHDMHPSWVFGIREEPFSAHCWVQAGGLVLNDSRDHVATYTPIMTV